MRIVLYSINYYPELTGIGKYNHELVQSWLESDHNVTVITSVPYYPDWKIDRNYRNFWSKETLYGGKLIIYRNPIYVPGKLTTIKRLIHLLSFSLSSVISIFRIFCKRNDVIFVLQPTLFTSPIALFYSMISKSLSVMHIQDFEVDAALGLGMAKQNSIFVRLTTVIEKYIYSKFDVVSTISNKMQELLLNKGVKPSKSILFPNWSSISNDNVANSQELVIKDALGLPSDKKVVLYSGNIGEKQGLDILIPVAQKFINSHPDVIFLIVGEGSYKATLQELVITKRIKNILFRGLQPIELLKPMLEMASAHLVIQKKGAADVVLPSKLTNILGVGGNAVVTAELNTELGIIFRKFPGIFHLCEPESEDDLYNSVADALLCDSLINDVALDYAKKNLNKENIVSIFTHELNRRARNTRA